MKVTVDIDCTPLEARQFFGLPDVQPMQQAVMAEMERRTLGEMEKFAPAWSSKAPSNCSKRRAWS